jgi:type IV pilus assembly protein PilF
MHERADKSQPSLRDVVPSPRTVRLGTTSVSMLRRRAIVPLSVAGLALWLTGCATPGPGGSSSSSREIVTASDETDVSRRARVRLELASAYFAQGQWTTALDEVKQALVANPNLTEGYNLRGLIYSSLGDQVLADESFRRALQINPRDADTLHNYGWYQCQQKRYAEAVPLFAQALAQPQYRDTARTLLAQGVCLAQAGQMAEAEQALQRAFEVEPANMAVAVNLAEVLFRRGDYERARFYIRRVNSRPDISSAQTLWLAARIEQRAGNRQSMEEWGTQLRNRFPQSREAAAYDRGQFND